MKDEENRVRHAAGMMLGSLEQHQEVALPALTAALEDKDSWVRLGVAEALWRLRPGDRRVVEVLIGLLNDSEPDVRNPAAAMRKLIGPEAAKQPGSTKCPWAGSLPSSPPWGADQPRARPRAWSSPRRSRMPTSEPGRPAACRPAVPPPGPLRAERRGRATRRSRG